MLLLEADGKALFRAYGIAVPDGVEAYDTAPPLPGAGPWVVKAQVPVGGRGKAGGVQRCDTPAQVSAALARILSGRMKGHVVGTCLVEAAVTGEERYLAIMVDAASYGLRAIYAAQGGIDVEKCGAASRLCPPHAGAVAEALAELTVDEPEPARSRIVATGRALATLVTEKELALAEVNPLFLTADGCVAGDAKVVIDLSAIDRQPGLATIVSLRPAAYADACRKLAEGFDYVVLDPQGEIGLVTTGAGLSMMLIDELVANGAKPVNFCDIRTGQMRGSPARLIQVLEWIAERPSLKVVMVNIFAGITDLGEFAGLLAAAIDASPCLRVPFVARLVGRNAHDARRILQQAQPGMLVTEDLNEAMQRVLAITAGAA